METVYSVAVVGLSGCGVSSLIETYLEYNGQEGCFSMNTERGPVLFKLTEQVDASSDGVFILYDHAYKTTIAEAIEPFYNPLPCVVIKNKVDKKPIKNNIKDLQVKRSIF